jgi:hypothetical protein
MMDHGMMQGMLWAGVVLSAVPVLLGVGIAVHVFQRYRMDGTPRGVRTPGGEGTS